MIKYFLAITVLISAANVGWCQRSPTKFKKERAFYQPLFTVDTAFWCADVDELGNPGSMLQEADLFTPVYFWVRLKANNSQALDLLEKIENPVIIKWFKSSGYGTSPEWGTDLQYNDMAIASKGSGLQSKRDEFYKSHMFTYTTWNKLLKLSRPGIYVVRLVFYDNSPLNCGGSPCTYQIKINK